MLCPVNKWTSHGAHIAIFVACVVVTLVVVVSILVVVGETRMLSGRVQDCINFGA